MREIPSVNNTQLPLARLGELVLVRVPYPERREASVTPVIIRYNEDVGGRKTSVGGQERQEVMRGRGSRTTFASFPDRSPPSRAPPAVSLNHDSVSHKRVASLRRRRAWPAVLPMTDRGLSA